MPYRFETMDNFLAAFTPQAAGLQLAGAGASGDFTPNLFRG